MSQRRKSSSYVSSLLLTTVITLNCVWLNTNAQELPTPPPPQHSLPQPSSTSPSRERRVVPPVTATTAPAASTAAPDDKSTTEAAAAPTSTLARSIDAPRTIEELRARIQQIVRQPLLAPAQFAVRVVSLNTNQILFEENANKLLHPASNMKLYTVAAALDRLSPDYRFTTSVYVPSKPGPAGAITGDMIVYGRGDPTFATRFAGSGDYYKGINELTERIAAAGVRRIEGDLIGDESYFAGAPLGTGWEWDDLQWYYGAEVSALSINDNALDLSVKPGTQIGEACSVTLGPATGVMTVINSTTTAPRGTGRQLSVHRPLNENRLEVSGSLPQDDAGYTASIAVTQPAMLFVSMLRTALEQRGVTITGRTRVVDARARGNVPLQTATLVEIANRQSVPLGIIAGHILKPSQNLYTELVLRALGKNSSSTIDIKRSTAEAGLETVKAFLREAGVDTEVVTLVDGSGLSRGNLISAHTTVQLLTYMHRHRYGKVFLESQPIAGIDGTLRTRMRGTLAASNVRAKTGSLNTIATLSGYVTTAANERLVFSLMINNLTSGDASRNYLDQIAVLLAEFNGRSSITVISNE